MTAIQDYRPPQDMRLNTRAMASMGRAYRIAKEIEKLDPKDRPAMRAWYEAHEFVLRPEVEEAFRKLDAEY